MNNFITVIGGGLAGCEAAWQAARRGSRVRLYEMRPRVPTAAHKTGDLAELVCSNSLKSDETSNAHGLLKVEMRRLGSLVLSRADGARVPAGAALAVDRERFAADMTAAIEGEPLIEIVREEVREIPGDGPVVIATGPLVSDAMARAIAAFTGSEYLYFYDAVSPIVEAGSIDRGIVFAASRYGKGDGADYLNCPMDEEQYRLFYEALLGAARIDFHDFDRAHFFEGCLPVEELALRGVDTLRFGPMKPVGLDDPRTGRRPYAVVQLRQDNLAADHYNMVGFQNQLKFGEQTRIFRLIPGLESAVFVRLGMIHRNSYINAPALLRATFQTKRRPDLFFAGQVSGVEGYVESAASGILAGLGAHRLLRGEEPVHPPPETALGALCRYISSADPAHYQPMNIAFGLLPPLAETGRRMGKGDKRAAMVTRAVASLDAWLSSSGAAPTWAL
jgi:methylenetetrahydrofolate--tRNA-(uracil-5-)-methyltransferase